MHAFRPLIHALIALVLLVQGFAVAAADRPMTQAKDQDQDQTQPLRIMPCHPRPADQASGDEAPGKGSCCNLACPDMLSCAFGAVISAGSTQVSLPRSLDETSGHRAVQYSPAPPGAAFRPPIRLPA